MVRELRCGLLARLQFLLCRRDSQEVWTETLRRNDSRALGELYARPHEPPGRDRKDALEEVEGEGGDDEFHTRPLPPDDCPVGPEDPRGGAPGRRGVLHSDSVPPSSPRPRAPREIPKTDPLAGLDRYDESGPRAADRAQSAACGGPRRGTPEREGGGPRGRRDPRPYFPGCPAEAERTERHARLGRRHSGYPARPHLWRELARARREPAVDPGGSEGRQVPRDARVRQGNRQDLP